MTTAAGEKHLELTVSNFGPIAEGTVELRPMTIFVGPSNTGKSYLATLIYALHRFFNGYPVIGSLERRLPFQNLPGSVIVQMENPAVSEDDIARIYDWAGEIIMRHDAGELQRSSVCELPDALAELVHSTINTVNRHGLPFDGEIVRCFGIHKAESLARHANDTEAGLTLRSKTADAGQDAGRFKYEVGTSRQKTSMVVSIPQDAPLRFTPGSLTRWRSDTPEYDARLILHSVASDVITNSVSLLSRPAHYLLTSRANLMHTHQTIVQSLIAGASQPTIAPTFSGVLGDFLERIVGLGDQRNQREAEDYPLALDLERNILGGAIRIASNPVGYPEFLYRPDGWERDLTLANTSSMVSELAPVVLYLRHVVQPGDTLIIEEPESHLHPTMQVELTRLLAAAVKAGIRIIITTHSEWILEELANLLLMSELPEDQRHGFEGSDLALSDAELGVWLFEPDDEVGGTVVEEIPLDKEMGKFPSDFGLVTVGLYNRFVRIANRIEMLKEE